MKHSRATSSLLRVVSPKSEFITYRGIGRETYEKEKWVHAN